MERNPGTTDICLGRIPALGGLAPIRVLFAAHQELARTGRTKIRNSQPDIEVVGNAADGIEVTRQLAGADVTDPIASSHLLGKLGNWNRVEMAMWAYQAGRVRA